MYAMCTLNIPTWGDRLNKTNIQLQYICRNITSYIRFAPVQVTGIRGYVTKCIISFLSLSKSRLQTDIFSQYNIKKDKRIHITELHSLLIYTVKKIIFNYIRCP